MDEPWEVGDDRCTETFGVVGLQDVEDRSGSGKGGVLGLVRIVDHDGQRPATQHGVSKRGAHKRHVDVLDAGSHEIHGTLEDPDDKVDLSGALFGVLSARTHVEGGSALGVVAKEELFASEGFGRDVFCRDERVESIVASPLEGALEAGDGFGCVVFRCAYVAQDALVGLEWV